MRRLANLFRSIRTAFREEWKLGAGILPILALLGFVTRLPSEKQVGILGRHGPAIVGSVEIVLWILLPALVALFLFNVGRRLRNHDPIPSTRFTCRVITSAAEARHINVELVRMIFPDAPIPKDGGAAAQAKNPRRLVGLIERDTNKIVGWASLWPVTKRVGREVEDGVRNDDEVSAADLIPPKENLRAPYLLLRSFAILPEYRGEPDNPWLRLGRFTLVHIIEEFLGSSHRSIRIVAIAYTEMGTKLCRLLGLQANGRVADYGAKRGQKDIYVAEMTRDDLCRRLGAD